jgi:hypothetical protein
MKSISAKKKEPAAGEGEREPFPAAMRKGLFWAS